MLVVRKKTKKDEILAYGLVQATDENPWPLGQFDLNIYEQVEVSSWDNDWKMIDRKTGPILQVDISL